MLNGQKDSQDNKRKEDVELEALHIQKTQITVKSWRVQAAAQAVSIP